MTSLPLASLKKCISSTLKKIPRDNSLKLDDTQFGFRPGINTTDQFFTLQHIFETSEEHGKDVFALFANLAKRSSGQVH